MKINSLKIKGVSKQFPNETSIDLTATSSGLIAIHGENGAGKTTIMESIFGSLFREFPSRPGAIYDFCTGKDAFIEMSFDLAGNAYRSLINIDADHKKQEAYLYNGEEPLVNGKVTDFDAYIEKHIGTSSLFLSTIFSAQTRKGNFLELPKSERKNLFARLLGLERLQELEEKAKDKLSAVETTINKLDGELAGLGEVKDVAALKEEIKNLQAKLSTIEPLIKVKEEELEDLVKDEALISTQAQRIKEMCDKVDKAKREKQDLENQLTHRVNEIKDLEKTLTDEPQIRQAIKDKEDLKPKQDENGKKIILLKEEIEKISANERARSDNRQKIARLNDDLVRIEEDTKILKEVPCQGKDDCITCKFLQRANGADEKKKEITDKIESLQTEQKELVESSEDVSAKKKELQEAEKERERMVDEMSELINTSAKLLTLENAKERLSEAKSEKDKLNTRIETLSQDLTSLSEAYDKEKGKATDISGILAKKRAVQQEIDELKKDIKQNETLIAYNEKEIEQAGKQKDRKAEVNKLMLAAKQDQAEWKLLAKGLGKDGIQALEIDSAGPEVSAIANDLLRECFGTRFSISFETTRLSGDGEKSIEVFDVLVRDNDETRKVENLSGGEKVILSEAISLAIAIFNTKKTGVKFETLFRDETAGALDPENAQKYILMLRKALVVGGFHQVIFIAQQPEVWQQADNKIYVHDGTIEMK
ncbi:MAG: AAA family ATPase [Patescibacteria group bacterium]